MATITVPSDPTLPVAGAEIKAAPLKDWITNIRTFLEATNIDEANVDTSGTDGIVGKSIAQTITGLKTFSNTSAAAGGLREVAKFEINPSSGTPANNDGLRMTFTADDAGGSATAIGYVDLKMTDASASSEDSEWRFSTIANASSVTPLVVNSTAITMTTSTVAIGTNATVGGSLTVTGGGTFGSLTVGSAAISEAELEMLDGITPGTILASKAVVVDSNKDASSFRNVTLTGELDAATLDISGNADIDGTTNLDAVDIDGAVQIDSTVTVGVDDQGYDVKFFGDTASAYLLWDTSADKLLTAGGATIDIVKDKLLIGGTAVTTTAAELNVLDAVSAGTVTASLAVVVDSNKDIGSFRNITLTGELDAGSLDVSGDADIDGTLEADAITLGGTALGSLYSPIAGSSSIVTVGTVGTGTWQGDVIASAYLDSDTAHLSGTQTFTGNKTFTGTITVGVDGTGKDVTFFGDTSGSKVVWDESADDLVFTNAGIAVGSDATGDIYYRNSSGFLSRLAAGADGTVLTGTGAGAVPAWETPAGSGTFSGPGSSTDNAIVRFNGTGGNTGQNSSVLIDDSNNITGAANITLSGELDAGSLDVSGDADIDGTLEADAITLGGTALGSLYSPIAGSSSIVTVGTISTGVWQGTPVASAYLDSDTAHLSTTQTFTGDKTFTGTVTVGVNDTGKDVKFFGATSGKYMEWDESADLLNVVGTAAIKGSNGNAAFTQLKLINDDSTSSGETGQTADLVFQFTDDSGSSYDAAKVGAIKEADWVGNADYDGALGFYTVARDASFSGSLTEQMRISSAGSLSLGTTAVGGSPGAGSVQFHKDSNNYVRIWDNATATLYMQANGANAPTIAMKNSDSDALDITTFQRTNAGGNLYGQSRNGLMMISGAPNGSFAVGTSNAKNLVLGTNNTAVITIDSSQQVGIGADSPQSKFEVSSTDQKVAEIYSSNANPYLVIAGEAETQNDAPGIAFNATKLQGIGSNHTIGQIRAKVMNSGGSLAGQLEFRTNAGDQETLAMTIDSSQRVGIGTESPSVPLSIVNDSAATLNIEQYTANANGPQLRLDKGRGSSGSIGAISSDDVLGTLWFSGWSSSGQRLNGASIRGFASQNWSVNNGGAYLVFGTADNNATSPSERWRITNTGQLTASYGGLGDIEYININTSTNAYASPKMAFGSNTSSSHATNGEIRIHQEQSAHADYRAYVYTQSSSNTQVFRVMGDGDVENANNSYGSTSDLKLKQDITEARSYWDNFKALQFKKFRFKKDVAEDENAGYRFGLIAQDVESIFPSLVKDNTDLDLDGTPTDTVTKSIKYSVLSQIGLRVVQELQTRLEAAEAKIAALEAA